MSLYQVDRSWSDRYIPTIKRLVGPYLLEEAPFEVDTKQATDLIVMKGKDLMIAARVRRPGYYEKYGNQFTIRCKRESGAETELAKIANGWADMMFYGFADRLDNTDISHWMLIDLAAWRGHMIRRSNDYPECGQTHNGDGTYFMWFNVDSFHPKPKLLIARF